MKPSSTKFRVKGFQVLEDQCIWMLSGVVNFRLCDKAYNCYDCAFDKAMSKAMGRSNGKQQDWADAMKQTHDGASRPCRHLATGRIQQPKICTNSYDCGRCEFDQMLDEVEASELRTGVCYTKASGYTVADDYYYHPGHTWVRVEHGGLARIGVDDFVMHLFGTAAINELPGVGTRITRNRPALTLAQQGNLAPVLSPVTGTVVAVNQRVKDHPEIMHTHPYENGWLLLVNTASPVKAYSNLFYGDRGIAFINDEFSRLNRIMGPEYEGLAATGGEPVADFFGLNPGIGWNRLVDAFLAPKKPENG